MSFKYRNNTGFIFKKKKFFLNSKYPDYKGTVNIGGTEFTAAAWKKLAKNGVEFISFQFVSKKSTKAPLPKNPYTSINKEMKKTVDYKHAILKPVGNYVSAAKNFFSKYYGEKEAKKSTAYGRTMDVDAPGSGTREGHKYMRGKTHVETKYRDRVTERIEKKLKNKS